MARMMNALWALIGCCLPAGAPIRAPYTEPRTPAGTAPIAIESHRVSRSAPADSVDQYVAERMRAMRLPGLALAVLKDGKLLKARGYGLANIETGTPATAATAFRIASLSKQFIATAVMLLVQEGSLSLDERAAPYLGGAPAAWKDITIRELLTHTAGLVRDPPDYHPYTEQPITEVIEAAYGLRLNSRPGDRFRYSNIG